MVRAPGRFHSALRTGVCRSESVGILGRVWILHPPRLDKGLISLIAGAKADNKALEVFYILPPFSCAREVHLYPGHEFQQRHLPFKLGLFLQ